MLNKMSLKNYYCEFLKTCKDTLELEKSQKLGQTDEDLADQYHNLCTRPGIRTGELHCTLRYKYLKQEKHP